MNRRKFLITAAALASTLTLTRRARAEDKPAEKAHTTRALGDAEGVLFDTDDSVIYTVNNQGGIDALELKSGKVRWSTPETDTHFYYPIAVVGERLITRAQVREKETEAPRVALPHLSTTDGKEIRVWSAGHPGFVQPFQWFETRRRASMPIAPASRVVSTAIASERRWRQPRHRLEGDQDGRQEVTFAAFEETQTQAATAAIIDLAKGTVKAKDVDEKADLPKTIDAVKSRKETKEIVVNKTIYRIEQKAAAPLGFKFQRVLTAIDPDKTEKPQWEHHVHGGLVPRR